MKTWPLLLLSVVGWIPDAWSQSVSHHVIATTGFSGSNGGSYLDFTVGELAVTTVSSETTFVSQGFHQTYLEHVSIHEAQEMTLSIHVFPNPTTDYVTIEIGGDNALDITAIVYDGYGKLLYTGTYPKAKTFQIDMSRWAAGQYYIRLAERYTHTPIKAFSIQKQIHQ